MEMSMADLTLRNTARAEMSCSTSKPFTMPNRLMRTLAGSTVVLLVVLHGPVAAAASVVVAGYGPERPVIEKLAHRFEMAHPGSVIDIRWNRNLKAIDMVKAGQADLAVSGTEEPDLVATPIAWDGIAVIVNFANSVKELTKADVAALFSGRVQRWSEVGGADTKVQVIWRPPDRNVTDALLQGLGLDAQIPASARVVRADQRVLSTVGGKLAAVGYISLFQALQAQEFGMPIRALLIDGVEPEEPTVRNGRYPLRRPVLLLSQRQTSPTAEAFIQFARSNVGQRILEEVFVTENPS
jgi:phosphate transport system substrate-binding protein